jgi:hypothetical protein
MKSSRFVANHREIVCLTNGNAKLLIPTEVPLAALEQFRRRLRDRVTRSLAWKRRDLREALRELTRHRQRRQPVERHIPRAPQFRHRSVHGLVRRRGITEWTLRM